MKTKVILIFAFIFLVVFNSISESFNSSMNNKLFSYGISIAPTSTGTLDGSAFGNISWNTWLQTELDFSLVNEQTIISNSNANSTDLNSTTSIELDVVRINQNLLWNILPFKIDWLKLHMSIIADYANINDKNYGIDSTGTNFYLNQTQTQYIKPLVSLGAGFVSNIFQFDATYEVSPLAINESISGSSIQNSATGPSTTNFSGNDLGLETHFLGDISIDLDKLGFYCKGKYSQHLGYNDNVVNGIPTPYAYETIETQIEGGIKLKFIKLSGIIPSIGIAYSTYAFTPNGNLSGNQISSTTNHWSLTLGFRS
jgi:hypothetical protein